MSIIEDTFKKLPDGRYRVVSRQIAMAILGGIGFVILFPVVLPVTIETFEIGSFIDILMITIMNIVSWGAIFLFIAMGLFTQITEIDLKAKKVRFTMKNIRGQSATMEVDIDDIGISAVRMGITDANPVETWIVRAGFCYDTANNETVDSSIWSREVTKIEERNALMFELYQFFFPDRPAPAECDLVTNGTAVLLLSSEQKTAFENGTLFKAEEDTRTEREKKLDRLLE